MPEIIHLLSERVANQIAAGEVVQRPASALKELIENAIDAGADEIQIITREGGKSQIQVVDNGTGMSPKDALMSFYRHATSKILESEDLFQIKTMGFRGEALASMAAISQIKMRTRHFQENIGTEIRIEGSKILESKEISCPIGTSIEIKNLFFNVPARRSFLKSDIIELRHLISELEKISLSYPQIFFSFFHNQKEILHLPKGSFLQRILHLFGNSISEKLVPIQEKTDILEITGYIGKPEFAKKSRGEQFFHLNGRFIRDPYLHHAIQSVYGEWIPSGHSPFYSIHLTLDPEKVDINVHPNKTEVKFQEEKLIYTLLQTAVKRSLGKFHLTPQIDFQGETGFEEMSVLSRNLPIQVPTTLFNFRYNPFNSPEVPYDSEHLPPVQFPNSPSLNLGAESFKGAPIHGGIPAENKPEEVVHSTLFPDPDLGEFEDRFIRCQEDSQAIFQMQKEYLVTSTYSGIIIIDQQAAHERILFERYLRIFSGEAQVSQQTLFPQTYSFSSQDYSILLSLLPDIRLLGFDIREFGKNTFIVEGIPTDLQLRPESPIFEDILSNFKENLNLASIGLRENLALSLSKRAAIKSGRFLTMDEMRLLIDELFACESPLFSPSHKPTYITVNVSEIKKKFKE